MMVLYGLFCLFSFFIRRYYFSCLLLFKRFIQISNSIHIRNWWIPLCKIPCNKVCNIYSLRKYQTYQLFGVILYFSHFPHKSMIWMGLWEVTNIHDNFTDFHIVNVWGSSNGVCRFNLIGAIVVGKSPGC